MLTIAEAMGFLDCSRRTLNRYMENRKLPFKKKGKSVKFHKTDLLKIATELIEKKGKHRPDTIKDEVIVADPKVVKKIIKQPSKDLLNNNGKQILMQVTQYLEEKSLLQHTTKEPILRYAIACQLHEKYQNLGAENDDKYFFDLAKHHADMIKHYEKELGLTPAALGRIKPKEDAQPIDIDPMEELMSGN